MKTLTRLALALVLPFVIYGNAHAEPAQRPSTRITDAYAKRLVAKAATAKGRFHQAVNTIKGPGAPKGMARVTLQEEPFQFNAATP
jgi:hypothetical protein